MTTPRPRPRPGLLGLLALALALALAFQAAPASAGVAWCKTDPLITVNGKTGHVYVESTEAMYASATGPLQIEVLVPPGSVASAVPLDNGFGLGYAIVFKEDARLAARGTFSEVRVAAYAPAADPGLPVRVTFHSDDPGQQDSTKTGYANQWILTGVVRI